MAEAVRIYLGATSLRCCLGDKHSTADAMAAGVCGLRFDDSLSMMAGRISTLPESVGGATRFESLIAEQVGNVLNESGLTLSDPAVQLVISTTKGNVGLLAGGCDPLPAGVRLHESARRVAAMFGCAREPVVISNACISGLSAMIAARRMLLDGCCRHAVVAGCDVLSEFIASGFASFKSVSGGPCRPYDSERDGLTLGEACGAVVLTSDRSFADAAGICLAGGAVTNDANHISGPSRTGDGLHYAIEGALAEAGITAAEAGFVNAHGTATLYNDEMESKALALSSLADTPMNGLKGYIGHTLGASGVVEAVLCAEQLRRGFIFGTCGFASTGTSVGLRISAGRQSIARRSCIKTASGFGGCNAAIVLTMEDTNGARRCEREAERAAVYELPWSELPFEEFIRREFRSLGEPNMKFYKMSDLCKAVYVSAENLLRGFDMTEYAPSRRAVILSNSISSLECDAEHQRILNEHLPEGASPAVFVYTLPNVAAGEVCIRHGMKGDNTFFIEAADDGMAVRYARRLIETGVADVAVCGWCEKWGEEWNVKLELLKLKQ